jgi:hypothetical protein
MYKVEDSLINISVLVSIGIIFAVSVVSQIGTLFKSPLKDTFTALTIVAELQFYKKALVSPQRL